MEDVLLEAQTSCGLGEKPGFVYLLVTRERDGQVLCWSPLRGRCVLALPTSVNVSSIMDLDLDHHKRNVIKSSILKKSFLTPHPLRFSIPLHSKMAGKS